MNKFSARSLSHCAFPYRSCDTTSVMARVGGRVVSRAVDVATGIGIDGSRQVLGINLGDSEDATFGPSSSRACVNEVITASSSSSATRTWS